MNMNKEIRTIIQKCLSNQEDERAKKCKERLNEQTAEKSKISYKDSSSYSELSKTDLFLGIASIFVGSYHGYCDAQGIPFEKEEMEFALTYGPAIVQGGLRAIVGGLVGFIGLGTSGATYGSWRTSTLERIVRGSGGAVVGFAAGAGVGGAIYGTKGGIETLIGYAIGYSAGYATK